MIGDDIDVMCEVFDAIVVLVGFSAVISYFAIGVEDEVGGVLVHLKV